MARGEPSSLYSPQSLGAESLSELARQVYEELLALSSAYNKGRVGEVEFVNVAPARPREGMIIGADGTNWNPGAGKGVYAYYSGAWNKLG